MYQNFLELCGFEKDEIDKELPRIKKAFEKLRITSEDIKRGEENIRRYIDVDLMGMRKILCIYFKELTNLMLAPEEKEHIFYTVMPTISPDLIGAPALQKPESVYAGFPDFLIMMTVGAIFNKLEHVYEAAERHCSTPGVAHCGCNQIRLGGQLLGLIPKPDLILSWGHYCDEVPKLDEMMYHFFDISVIFINRCQDENWHEFPEATERTIDFYSREMRKAVDKIGDMIGSKIPDAVVVEGLIGTLQYFMMLARIAELMASADPVPLSQNDNLYLLNLYLLGVSPENRDSRLEAITLLYQELQERVKQGKGVTKKGAPRVLHTGFPSFVNLNIIKLIDELDLQIPMVEAQLYVPGCTFMPDLGDIDDLGELDPYKVLVKAFLCSCLTTVTSKRIANLVEAAEKFEVDGMLFLHHFSCRTYGTESQILRDGVRKALNIPTQIVESDIFDSRYYTREQLRTRLEAFAEMLSIS